MYVGLRFKSNPVLTLPHVPRFDRRGNNARNIVGQLILFFPPSFKGSPVLRFYPALCYPGIPRYHHSGIPFSFAQRLDSSYYVTAFVSRARFSPGDEIFDLRFVTSLFLSLSSPSFSFYFFLFPFSPFPAFHSGMLARNVKQETAEIKRSLFLSLSLSPSSFFRFLHPTSRRRRSRRRANTSSYFFHLRASF